MCATPAFIPPYANANIDSLISVVEDFSPPLSPTLTDFSRESDGDELFLETGRGYLLELG